MLREPIYGYKVFFTFVNEEDASYIVSIRSDGRYNQYLSKINQDIETQKAWIRNYKEREKQGLEYYFIINRISNQKKCGLVRMYEITDIDFTWGSWILEDDNKPPKAALDTAMLIYKIGFELLGLQRAVFQVVNKNQHTIDFHLRFGAIQISTDEHYVNFILPKERYYELKPKYEAILNDSTEM